MLLNLHTIVANKVIIVAPESGRGGDPGHGGGGGWRWRRAAADEGLN